MTDRRNFLKQLGLLGVAVTAGNLLTACSVYPNAAAGSLGAPLGLQLYTLRDIIGKDVKGVLTKVAQMGYTAVEPYGFSSKDGFWGMKPKELLDLLNVLHLTAPSGHYGASDFLLTGDTKELDAAIEAAAVFKTEFFTIPSLPQELTKTIDDYKRAADGLNKVAEKVKSAGMLTAYHNHNAEFMDKGAGQTGYDVLLKATNPDLIKFEMDIYWVVRAGQDPIKLIEENKGRMAMWHVKDMDKVNHELNTEVGNGTIDFKTIFTKAKDSGLKYFFVEQENNYKPDDLGAIAASAAYIKSDLI